MNFLLNFFLKRKYRKKADRRAILTISFKPDMELPIEVWTYLIKQRTVLMCEDCGKTGYLAAHHITRPEDGGKNNLRNGRCLCGKCHIFYTWDNRKTREHRDKTESKFIHTFGVEKGKEIACRWFLCKTRKQKYQLIDELVEKHPTEMSKYYGFKFYD